MNEAATSPKTALIRLSVEIEKETRRILGSVGLLRGRSFIPLRQGLGEIEKQYGGLPGHLAASLRLFSEARNRLVHGSDPTNDQILQAIDSGITILRSLQAVPREVNVVVRSDLIVYQDPTCEKPYTDIVGVVLKKESAGGARQNLMIFPTTRKDFAIGDRVSWEWNQDRVVVPRGIGIPKMAWLSRPAAQLSNSWDAI